ncbi:hypothetical protein ACUN0C_17520 [Faunimonas sp. B44]|uniref:hypothetical protein n=1 Tax=Faunimonas sp. B44 TaxID=3461493 RepID=UPI0040442FF9
MIQSAMMFALGAFVSGLVALVVAIAFVGRARRLTAAHLTARLATRRAEFEIERDELRARHAIETRRLEREVDRLLDSATAYRLNSDMKEQELASVTADLAVRDEEIRELYEISGQLREELQALHREKAEAAAALREAEQTIEAERARLAAMQAELSESRGVVGQYEIELARLRGDGETLRASLRELSRTMSAIPDAADYEILDAPWMQVRPLAEPEPAPRALGADGEPAPEAAPSAADHTPETKQVERIARDLHRMAGEAAAALGGTPWRASGKRSMAQLPATAAGPMLDSPASRLSARVASVSGRREKAAKTTPSAAAEPEQNSAEKRFLDALAEIRSLKPTSPQPVGD